MATEVRALRSDAEYERHAFISHYAFNQKRDEAAFARRRTYYDPDWCLGAFDAGEMVAGLVVIPFEQYVSGAKIRLGGIASVSCLPERRRGGHVGALLRESLASMRDAGQVLSGLYTPHYSLYRKFGWEIASRMLSYSFPPKVTRPRMAQPAGSFQRVAPDAWQRLATMHTAHYAIRNGAFARTEKQWRNHVFSDYGIGERDAAISSAFAVAHPDEESRAIDMARFERESLVEPQAQGVDRGEGHAPHGVTHTTEDQPHLARTQDDREHAGLVHAQDIEDLPIALQGVDEEEPQGMQRDMDGRRGELLLFAQVKEVGADVLVGGRFGATLDPVDELVLNRLEEGQAPG